MIKIASLLEWTEGVDTRYVGNIDAYGSIRMPPGQNGNEFHSHYGWENSHGKFAYWPVLKKVSWWERPDEDTAMRVEDFLKRRGMEVKFHADAVGSKMMDALTENNDGKDPLGYRLIGIIDSYDNIIMPPKQTGKELHIDRGWESKHGKFAYFPNDKRVSWWQEQPDDKYARVEDYLEKHGYKVRGHFKWNGLKLKDPLLTEETASDKLTAQIKALENEWEKLDSQGTGFARQSEIHRELQKLQMKKIQWDAMYRATDVPTVGIATLDPRKAGMRENNLNEGTRPDRFGLGQMGQYDEIEFVWIPSIEHRGTQHSDKFTRPSNRRFRFYYGNDDQHGLVYWVTSPTSIEDAHAVENFFAKRGIEVVNRDKSLDVIQEGYIMENVTQEQANAAIDFLKQMVRKGPFRGKVYIAGGAVRDMIRGKIPKDLDLVVTDNGEEGGMKFAKWLAQEMGNFKEGSNPVLFPTFGTAKVVLKGVQNGVDLDGFDVEAVFARKEVYTPGSRKPQVFPGTIQDDAFRRDFTVNSLMLDLTNDQILDITGKGQNDIKAGLIQTTSNPDEIFGQDALRMFRAIRFATKYKWKIEDKTWQGIKNNLENLSNTSMERVRDELNNILLTDDPAYGIRLLRDSGLLPHVATELQQAVGMTQNIHHKHDVFDHTLDVLKNTKPELMQRLMALFHDIGKVVTRSETPTGVHFYGHETAGEEVVDRILRNLKYPLDIINAVKMGVKNHMRLKQGGDSALNISDKALRKFKMELGDNLEHVLDVIHADNIAHADASAMPNQIEKVRQRLNALNVQVKKPVLPINGDDLAALGIKPGQLMGKMLSAVTDAWFENPNLTREDAIAIVQRMV